MNQYDFNEVYGYYLLVEQNLPVYNPQYVARYGSFMWCLMRLDYKKKKNDAYLRESYTNSAESAKFFATCPKDLSGMSARELRALREKAKAEGLPH